MFKGQVIKTINIDHFKELIAREIISCAKTSIKYTGKFNLALSGGTTPRPVLKILAKNFHMWDDLTPQISVFITDERCVSHLSNENNFQLIHRLWLRHHPEINRYRIKGWQDPELAAREYSDILKAKLPSNNGFPEFDMIFMGIGNDGHVASIFPDIQLKSSHDTHVEAVYVPCLEVYRITMNMEVLNNARNRIIGIVGKDKEKILNELRENKLMDYPVAGLLKSGANDKWVVTGEKGL